MTTLITGGGGFLGSSIARALRERGEAVLLWLHAGSDAEFQEKRASFDLDAEFSWGDLADDEPFSRVDPDAVRGIVHAAAITRFNVEEELADSVNVRGTERALEFAAHCPQLSAFDFFSTLYATGLRDGEIPEAPARPGPKFANHYERSKWESEERILSSGLPSRIFRIPLVVCDDDSGSVSQYNAIHNTLRLIYYGMLSLMPGDRETPIYLTSAQFVADAYLALRRSPPDGKVFHLAPSPEESITLGELLDLVFEVYEADPDYGERRLLRPLMADSETFELLASGVKGFGGKILDEAIGSVVPFAPQLFVHKQVHNERTLAACDGLSPPPSRDLVRSMLGQLIQTRWGRQHAS